MRKHSLQSNLRYFLVCISIANLLLIGIQLLRYPPLLNIQGALLFIIEPVVLLIIYALAIFWFTKKTDSTRYIVLREGTKIGLLCGGIEIIHLIQENFIHFGGNIDSIVNIGFMVGVFLLWGIPSYRVTRITKFISQGLLSSIWAVIITMLIAVFFGFIQEFYIHIPAPSEVATWGEYTRSGWKDIPAFTIANTLGSASTHLLIGPIVSIIVGSIAGVLGLLHKPKNYPFILSMTKELVPAAPKL